MHKYCDLHTHSCCSDGTSTPAQVIEAAAQAGLSAVALTDHNTVSGLAEFAQAGAAQGIWAIPGVEISTGYSGRELHIVGLFLDPACYGQVMDFLSVINRRKAASNRDMIARLNAAGYALDYDAICAQHRGNVNRAVIASVMLEKGYIPSIKEAFKHLLSEKGGYFVPPERIPALEAIEFLKSIRAVPVLAHPFLNLNADELRIFLKAALPHGLAAMETRYSTYTPETTAEAMRIAAEFGMLESGGSDFHGRNKPDISIGVGRGDMLVPQEIADQLAAYQKNM